LVPKGKDSPTPGIPSEGRGTLLEISQPHTKKPEEKTSDDPGRIPPRRTSTPAFQEKGPLTFQEENPPTTFPLQCWPT